MIVLDTSAWVEYFVGSRKGREIEGFLKSERDKIATPVIVLIELGCKAYKEKTDFKAQMDFVRQNSALLRLDEGLVTDTAKIYVELRGKNRKISLADAIILATARKHNATLVTCDSDFVEADGVRIVF